MDFHCSQTILEYTLILVSEPLNCFVYYLGGHMRYLAVINLKTYCYLLSIHSLVGDASIVWIELESFLEEALYKLLIVQ